VNGWHRRKGEFGNDFPAAFHADRAAAADPTDWDLTDRAAVAWHRLGQEARAKPLFRKLLEWEGVPGTVRRSAMIGLGDWAAAADHATARLRSGHTEEADWVDLGLIRLRFGDVNGFRAHCREFRRVWGEANPRVVLLYCLHPDSAADAEPAWEAALAALNKWREKPQPDFNFTKAITRLLYRMGRFDDCTAAFAARDANWLTGDPDDWLFRGRAALRAGNLAEAKKWLTTYRRHLPAAGRASGNLAEAKKWLTKPSPDRLPMRSNHERLDWQRRDALRELKWEAADDIMQASR